MTRLPRLAKALDHAVRAGITEVLGEDGRASTGTLAEAVGVPLATISHHLGIMVGAGLVTRVPVGREVEWQLAADVVGIADALVRWANEGATDDDDNA